MKQELNNHKEYYEEAYDDIICPSELMGVHYKGAVKKRNRWMVENSTCIVAYVHRDYGGAYEAMQYAKQKKKYIINLADK